MRNALLIPALLCTLLAAAQADSTLPAPDSVRIPKWEERNFSVGAECGMGIALYRLNTTHTALAECRKHHDEPMLSGLFALKVRYRLNDRLELMSGLSYYETGFSFSEEKQLSDTLGQEFVLGCEIGNIVDPKNGYTGIGFFDSRYATIIYGLHPGHGTMHVKLKYNYIDVPLLLKVQLGKKQTRCYVAGGAGVNYLVGVTERIFFSTESEEFGQWVLTDVPAMYRRWNFSAQAAFGVEQLMSDRLSSGFQVSGKYHLQSIFGSSAGFQDSYKENHFAFWIEAGVYYRLGKSAH